MSNLLYKRTELVARCPSCKQNTTLACGKEVTWTGTSRRGQRMVLAAHWTGGDEGAECAYSKVLGFQEETGLAVLFCLENFEFLPKGTKICTQRHLGVWAEIPLEREAA